MTASLDLPDFLTASRLADLAARISEDGDHRMLTTAVDGVLDSAGDSASDRASDRANDQARPAHGPRAPELARGAPRIPPEPYVPPWDAGRTCRVVIGCAALVAGGAILAVSTRGSLRLPVLDAILDWTLGELSPYSALVLVAASAAFLGTLPGLALGDRHRPGLVRKRIRWYRRQLGRLRTQALTAAVGPTGELDGDSAALDRRIRDRLRLAGAQRSLELLEPLGWTILASSIAWPWVEGRFPDVPARAGATLLAAALALALLCRRLAASIGR